MNNPLIITVGFCPAWDMICRADDIDWGRHVRVSQSVHPAGKALNVSRVLAWLGKKNVAAGLWGQRDWPDAQMSLSGCQNQIDFHMTLAAGHTRRNVTVIDTRRRLEMHLRAPCSLATRTSLAQLAGDLKLIIRSACWVVFSGAMPEGDLLDDCLTIIQDLCRSGVKVAVDSSGLALSRAVELGGLALIKPNLEELGQLLGRSIPNDPLAIEEAARVFCNQSQIILVSRGPEGAMIITKDRRIECRAEILQNQAEKTVGCGDYLLAGFLASEDTADLCERLGTAVKAATAHAIGLSESMDWPTAAAHIRIEQRQT